MTLRVADRQISQGFIQQIFQQRGLLETVRQQISTGLRVSRPSDDSARAGTIQLFQDTLQRLERHQQRIGFASNLLGQQETTIAEAQNIIIRATELAQNAANGTLSPENRALLAQEVWGLRDAMVSLANTQIQGRYIYGGSADDTPPFIADTYDEPADPSNQASVRYVFDESDARFDVRDVTITDSIHVRVNTDARSVFEQSITAIERLGRALAGFRTEPADPSSVPDGTGSAYTFPGDEQEQQQAIIALIDTLNSARNDDLLAEQTNVGGRLARVEQAANILAAIKIDTESSRSTFQDADIFEAASRFSAIENGFQATLAVGSRINNLSLLNFL